MPQTAHNDSTLAKALLRLNRTEPVREAMKQTAVSRAPKQTLANPFSKPFLKPFSNLRAGDKRRGPRVSEKRAGVENAAKRACNDEHKISNQFKSEDHPSKRHPRQPMRRSARLREPVVGVPTKSSDETYTAASSKSERTPNNSESQEFVRLTAAGAVSLIDKAAPVTTPNLPRTKSARVVEVIPDIIITRPDDDAISVRDEEPTSQTSAPSRPSFTFSSEFAYPLPPQSVQQPPQAMRPTHHVPLPPFSTFHEFSSLPPPPPQSRLIPTTKPPELPTEPLKLPSFAELVESINSSQPPPRIEVQDFDNRVQASREGVYSYETYSETRQSSHPYDSYHI
ncbi:hypothetical protein GGR58DRAFT_165322 [Xylaria digitata]|nr:hypothetical protein GGR58DRAFT_165322 [Xylaria digitata]